MKNLSCLILFLAGVSLPARSQETNRPPLPTGTNAVLVTAAYLNDLAEEMRAKNPALLAARARTNAAGASVGAVRSWEDPKAILGYMGAREQLREADGDLIYGVEQKLPISGKPKLARRVAQAELATETAQEVYAFQNLKKELARAAFRAALADERVVLGEQDVGWLQALAQNAERKYSAGQATLFETTQAQNELAKRTTQLATERDMLTHERVGLNRLLTRNLDSPWPPLTLPLPAGPIPYSPKLVNLSLKNEPRVRVLQQQIRQAEATVELTQRQRTPDISVGLEGRSYTGNGTVRQLGVVFGMDLPWFNNSKYRNDIKRDRARLGAAEFDLADYQQSVSEEVHRLTVTIAAARREALLYHDEIIPRSEAALESARAGWESNRGSFRDLLDARRMWLDGRVSYVRAVAEQYDSLSELVLCCGLGDLGALEMIGAGPGEN